MMKNFQITVISFFILCLPIICPAQNKTGKIEVLIVDGFSNHDWKQTTQMVKFILEGSGLFNVSVSTSPSVPDDPEWKDWDPPFKKYDVVIQNSNNIQDKTIHWPDRVKKKLENYVRTGGGLYILHAANNAFADWEEYNKMIGLGWRKPDQGVAIQITDDEEVRKIPVGEGKSTYHGPRNDEVIRTLNNHPVNSDFPKAWKTPDVELYKYARGPAENLTVISYAKERETGINWPVEWVIKYGKGKVYNSSMGHLWTGETYPISYRCKGFQTTMIRATEWLAKGTVSYPLPDDFPTETQISVFAETITK